jgi:TetR/AcrR family transcriptional regulator, transcriptional repressor for nem operon
MLHTVRDQFWGVGYAATSLQDLMRVTNLGKGSIYAAYGDKHQLFLRTLRGYVDESHAILERLIEDAPRAIDLLRDFVAAGASPEAPRGCYLANSTCELATTDPEVATMARNAYEKTTTLVAGCVERAKQEGDLPADADAMSTARALLAAQQGIVFMGRAGLDGANLAATARALASSLLPETR